MHPGRTADGTPDTRAIPLRICLLGLGGGGWHRQISEIIRRVRRPLELLLVFSGPGGGISYWKSDHTVHARYVLRGPSLWADRPATVAYHGLMNLVRAAQILISHRPDVILAVGTPQSIPFAIVGSLFNIPLWFIESLTRVHHPSRTGTWVYRANLHKRFFYYWPSLRPYYPRGECVVRDACIRQSRRMASSTGPSAVGLNRVGKASSETKILVTVGTHHFDELARAVDEAVRDGRLDQNVIIQLGNGQYRPTHCEYFKTCETLEQYYDTVDLVVAHGGTGTTLEVIGRGLRLVSVANPMMQDNHQHEFLERLEQEGLLQYCRDLRLLPDLIRTSLMNPAPFAISTDPLFSAVGRALDDVR